MYEIILVMTAILIFGVGYGCGNVFGYSKGKMENILVKTVFKSYDEGLREKRWTIDAGEIIT